MHSTSFTLKTAAHVRTTTTVMNDGMGENAKKVAVQSLSLSIKNKLYKTIMSDKKFQNITSIEVLSCDRSLVCTEVTGTRYDNNGNYGEFTMGNNYACNKFTIHLYFDTNNEKNIFKLKASVNRLIDKMNEKYSYMNVYVVV